jgi:hypothetical protein
MVKLFKHISEEKKQEEDSKDDELQLTYVIDLSKSGFYKNEEEEEVKLSLSEVLKQFFTKLTEIKESDLKVEEIPKFIGQLITFDQFTNDEWKTALSENIINLENIVSEAKHLLSAFIQALPLPLLHKKEKLKASDFAWVEEDSFDVWPQFAVLGSILDAMLKDKPDSAIATF